jgi:anti-sigma factor RsiW
MPEPGRQGRDMPNRLPASHADHDLVLVAAHAAGDVNAAERTTAEALLAACPDCRELAGDLRAIAAATATLPAPARARDFTLRPEDGARLRPRGWRRLAAALGPGRLELTRPLAPVLMTLGLVGLLVSGAPLFQASAGGSPASERAGAAAVAASAAPSAQAPVAAAASAAPAASTSRDNLGAAPAPSASSTKGLYGTQVSPSPATDLAGGGGYAPASATPPPEVSVASPPAFEAPGPNLPLAAISALALVAGLALFGLRRALRTTPGR